MTPRTFLLFSALFLLASGYSGAFAQDVERIYFASYTNNEIGWVDPVTKTVNILMDVTNGVEDTEFIKVNQADGKLYFCNYKGTGPSWAQLKRADLDGTNLEFLTDFAGGKQYELYEPCLDNVNNKVYYSDHYYHNIWVADRDGSNRKEFIYGYPGFKPRGMAIDSKNRSLYFANNTVKEFHVVDLDNPLNVYTILYTDEIGNALVTPQDVELDLVNQKIYYCDTGSGKILQSDMNGNNITMIYDQGQYLMQLAKDPYSDWLYFTDYTADQVSRIDVNTKVRETMATVDRATGLSLKHTWLSVDTPTISAATGGMAALTLTAGINNAARPYLVFGGVTKTKPGTPLPEGLLLPINWDIVTSLFISLANTPILQNFMSTLDNTGSAIARFNAPGPLPPETVGLIFYFAYPMSNPWDLVSNHVTVEVVP